VSVEQAAGVLGIGRSTAYELVRSGDLPSLRLRRRIVVPVARLADRLGVSVQDVAAAIPLRTVHSDEGVPSINGETEVVVQAMDGSPTLF
jgi:excisionase family DNA binding protein